MREPLDELALILAPQGIKTVTTGADEVGALLMRRWGSADPEQITARWRVSLAKLRAARVVLLGVPMDAGAGFERGSFKGPLYLRQRLFAQPGALDALERAGVFDAGDVRVNPHMIDDSMYTPELLASVRASRGWDDPALPVAPHSILARALTLIHVVNPLARVHLMGGDHSISRLPVAHLAPRYPGTLGVFHLDAHTDLSRERDGVPHNFSTWAYYANEAIGRGGRMVQVGIRTSAQARAYWEGACALTQWWSAEAMADPDAFMASACDAFTRAGVRQLYISHDIDATDPRWAAATGTRELNGLTPQVILRWLDQLGARFEIVGADIVEVAPPLSRDVPGEPGRTVQTALAYTLRQLELMTGRPIALDAVLPQPAP